jgi:acyl-homoserine lactone acylase PvdQ
MDVARHPPAREQVVVYERLSRDGVERPRGREQLVNSHGAHGTVARVRRGLLIACLLLAAPGSARAAEPYWSLLGIGQGETVNAAELAAATGSGEPPATFVNQRDLFNELLYEAPAVRTGELDRFFKPAPLDPPSDATSTSPKAGVTVSRDDYNVPYVSGETRADTLWGVGWATAEDRLFFMDVLRYTAKSRLTELAGPGEDNVNLEADVAQLSVTDYDTNDLSGMLDRLGRSSPRGAQVVQDLRDYTEGVNAYIAAARADASLLPAEYPALGRSPDDWQMTDSVAILGLLNGYFGLGGGREADVAMAYREAIARFGGLKAPAVLADFRAGDDPEAPVVTTRRFPYFNPRTRLDEESVAFLDRGSLEDFPRLTEGEGGGGGVLLQRGLPIKRHASNAMVIPGAESETGNPLFVAGPQVDFYSPAVFLEMAISGPGIEARGVGVPGVGPYILVGRGKGFAWSITTAQGDLADEFAEKLCEPDGSAPTLGSGHYLYRGRCRPLKNRTRELIWTPGPADLAADPAAQPGRWTVKTQLSAHGPIVGRATVRGRPVAIAFNRSTYLNEAESALGFLDINTAGRIDGPRDFMRAAGSVTGSYNFFYADDRHAAYVQSGRYPRRARTSPILPTWGTGEWDWRGTLPYRRLPKAVDPRRGYIVSWNNKQAPGWRASDADWQYGPVHRSQRLEKRVRAGIRGRRKLDLGELVGIMGDAGTVDVRGQSVLPWLLRVIGRTDSPEVAALRNWLKDGAHRSDLDRDNVYDYSYSVALMDAWWTPMVRAVFEPVLGRRLFNRIADINQVDYTPRQGPDTWYYGWMGYVQKDMRALLGGRIAEPPSRVYCGRGSRKRCRATLLRTLGAAGEDVPTDIEVPATCEVTDPPQCDQLDFITAGAVETPPIPWQDRGTFQQAAEPGSG